uniref:Uncharacterized protein n=1 Tax=viral metagenome TaxID=1070528 RepID=A0A6C0C7U1_9ZZZZ
MDEKGQTLESVKFNPLTCITGKISLTPGGIPPIQREHWPDDDKRKFINLPFDDNQRGCRELREFLEKVDAHFESKEMKEKIFGDKTKKYVYSPLTKEKSDGESNY